jgi:hypothetical protein
MAGWVYNSERYAIVAFPRYDALELIDKETQRSAFVSGETAHGLHRSIIGIPEDERTTDAIDELLDEFCLGRVQPFVAH